MLHWLVAVAVFGLFALGFWMVGLNYYSSWYRTAPDLHKSIGILLLLIMLLRVLWRFVSPAPAPLASQGRLTRIAARLGHSLLYSALFVVMVSGYLLSTADGRPIGVRPVRRAGAYHLHCGPADRAGLVHEYAAWALVILAVVHALAALKHHFIDRDATLMRMLGRSTD